MMDGRRNNIEIDIGIVNLGDRSTGISGRRAPRDGTAGSGVHSRIGVKFNPVEKGAGTVRGRSADEQVASGRGWTEIVVIEGAGVNVHAGCGVAHAAHSDVDAHQSSEVRF